MQLKTISNKQGGRLVGGAVRPDCISQKDYALTYFDTQPD
jgi:hypothetical protein